MKLHDLIGLYIFLLCTQTCLPYGTDIAGAECSSRKSGKLSMNSKCYMYVSSHPLSWYHMSNFCLRYHGESLAVFTDIGRPSDSSQLTVWLTVPVRMHITYWIGLVRSWWKTTNEGNI